MAGGGTEKKQAYWPIHCTRSDGAGYDYGEEYDDATRTRRCEETAVDLRWRIHLGGYLKRELASGADSTFDLSVNHTLPVAIMSPLSRIIAGT